MLCVKNYQNRPMIQKKNKSGTFFIETRCILYSCTCYSFKTKLKTYKNLSKILSFVTDF